LIERINTLGIMAADHLTALDGDSVNKIRRMLASAPVAGVVEERVNNTVRRRRSRRSVAGDAPEVAVLEVPSESVPADAAPSDEAP